MHLGTWVVGSSGWSLVDLLTGGLLRPPDTWLLLVIVTGGRASIPVRMLAWAPAGHGTAGGVLWRRHQPLVSPKLVFGFIIISRTTTCFGGFPSLAAVQGPLR
jgi:hypothetical protein